MPELLESPIELAPPVPYFTRKQTRYRFGFALTTALGNQTRYQNFRKYADCDPEVECVWAPIKHWLEGDPYKRLPGPVRSLMVQKVETRPVVEQWRNLDAIMIHAFQFYTLCSFKRRQNGSPMLIISQDYAPEKEEKLREIYGQSVGPRWQQHARFLLHSWLSRRADLCIPYSHYAAKCLIEQCNIPQEKVYPIHVGVDLDIWPYHPLSPGSSPQKPRILFVGGDFERKGGALLLDIFTRHFSDLAELHLVTRYPPPDLPSNVYVYTDLKPNDGRIQEIYRQSDLFVLPTKADMCPFVVLEAMATGRPVIATRLSGIPYLVDDGISGLLIEPNDAEGLRGSLERLLRDPALRAAMGNAGRMRVEKRFSSRICAQEILNTMKRAVDARRATR